MESVVLECLHLGVVVVVEGLEDADKVCDCEHPNEFLFGVVPEGGGPHPVVDEGVESLKKRRVLLVIIYFIDNRI